MPRRLRIEFEGAVYHVMTRGNARQDIVHSERRRRSGHLFQGRYKAEMIEDESYYWTVSRYIHLNPARAGLVTRPEEWEWSSYFGYVYPARRRAWVHNETLLSAWRGEWGERMRRRRIAAT